MSRATLSDIANKVGMSVSAVSLVLNNKPNRISEAKREAIKKAALELDYIPNQNAIGLLKKHSNTLGVIIPDISNLFFAEMVSGIDKAAREKNCSIIITNTSDDLNLDIENARILLSRNVDAIIMVPAASSTNETISEYNKIIETYKKPVILVDRYAMALKCSTISVNHQKGAYIAVKHLFELGHRKIAFITGPRQQSIDRIKGVYAAFEEYGLTADAKDFYESNYLIEGGYITADEVLKKDYTAIFCFNDLMAYGLYKRLRQLQIKVPDDISVIGYDDIFLSEYLEVPLTTIKQPAFTLGQEAAKRAFFEIENPGYAKQTIFFEPEIQIRKSTGKPRVG